VSIPAARKFKESVKAFVDHGLQFEDRVLLSVLLDDGASLNPISYAMMGLLPQMPRSERTIANVVSILMKKAYGTDYQPKNIPCKYLRS